MKKVKCSANGCEFVEHSGTHKPRGSQMCEVPDSFDESREKCFCSFTCACSAGYMTINKKHFEEKGGIEVGGSWWLKDPSGGKDKRFKKLWEREQNGK